jgi:hypothetical protein
VSQQARLENYRVMLELQSMQEATVSAVERVFAARADVTTAQSLIKQKQVPGRPEDETLTALGEQAKAIQKELLELENRLRVPPETRGYVYDDDKAISQVYLAREYVGSSYDAPGQTARVYIEMARATLNEAIAAVDQYMNSNLPAFSQSLSDAGIGLFNRSIN